MSRALPYIPLKVSDDRFSGSLQFVVVLRRNTVGKPVSNDTIQNHEIGIPSSSDVSFAWYGAHFIELSTHLSPAHEKIRFHSQ